MGNIIRNRLFGFGVVIVFCFMLCLTYRPASRNAFRTPKSHGQHVAVPETASLSYLQIGEKKQEIYAAARESEISIPFLGAIRCISADYTVMADRISSMDQDWTVSWTVDGSFLAASYVRPGFVEEAYDRKYIEDVYTARTQRIVGVAKGVPRFKLSKLRRIAAQHGEFIDGPDGIQQVKIKRVILSSEEVFRNQEVYIMTIWAKGVLQSPSFTLDSARIIVDANGNALFKDNGL